MTKAADTQEPEDSEIGKYVGVGCHHVQIGEDAWTVDPETGCITGKA